MNYSQSIHLAVFISVVIIHHGTTHWHSENTCKGVTTTGILDLKNMCVRITTTALSSLTRVLWGSKLWQWRCVNWPMHILIIQLHVIKLSQYTLDPRSARKLIKIIISEKTFWGSRHHNSNLLQFRLAICIIHYNYRGIREYLPHGILMPCSKLNCWLSMHVYSWNNNNICSMHISYYM